MNTKRVFALLLVLVLVLVLTPGRAAKAEGRRCPDCGEPLIVEYSDYIVHRRFCSNLCGYGEYESHTLDKNCWCSVCEHYCHDLETIGCDVHTQPTCTEPGLDYDSWLYLCRDCGNYTNNSGSIVNPITADALGHDWGDWVNNGDNHYRLCQRDGCETRDEAAHNYGNWTYVDEKNCKGVCECGAEITDAHYDQYEKRCGYQPHCEKCDHNYGTISPHEMYYDPRSATEHKPYCYHCDTDFPLEAHSGGKATCVQKAKCEKCGSEYGNPDPVNGHDWDTDWTWDDKEHWHPCNNEGCEAKLDAEAHSAHDPKIEQPGKPATCTEEGTTDATFCSVCGAPISEQEIIEPLGHQLTPVAKVEATCTAPGTEAYWKCTRDGCGMLFSDADGKNKITAPAAIDPLGHKWDAEWSYDENDHYHKCLNDGCTAKSDDEAAHTGGTATCTAKAKCTVCGAEYGDFAEHVYPANVWWEDENEHWHVCNVCDQPSAHEVHSGGTATCTEQAKCDVCHIPYGEPLGHQITLVDMVIPTCTEDGMLEHYECTRCGKVFGDAAGTREVEKDRFVMPASGHTEVVDAAVAPTCTETGLTEGKHCSVCKAVLEEQKTIDALGHRLSPVAKVEPTCTTPGILAYWKCTRCNKLFSDADGKNEITAPVAIKALGHNWGGWTVLFEGETARKTRVCTRCKECELKKIPAPEKPSSPNGDGIDIIASAELPFMDVTRGMDIYDDVKYVYEKGIMDGMSDTLFGPELPMTRGMIATILHRMAGEPKAPYSGVFSDVPAGQWYTDGVEWAASAGLVLGYGDGTYGTTDNVTREQLAVILYRYAVWKGYAVKTAYPVFQDSEDVSTTAVEAMNWAVANGILRPDGDHNIRPGADATRGEIATAIHAFLENVAR